MPETTVTTGSLRILSSGIALPVCPSPTGPRSIITNDDLARILTTPGLPERRVQAIYRLIRDQEGTTRHWSHWIGAPAHPDEPDAVTLGAEAARNALDEAGLAVEDIDLLILSLSTSTLPTIATSTPLAVALGYRGPSLDLKAGCAGSLYALHLASSLLASGYRRILVVGTDTMTKYLDPESLLGFLNVGDAAGALILERGAGDNFVSSLDGEYSTWDVTGVLDPLPPRPDAKIVIRGAPGQLRETIAHRYRESFLSLLDRAGVPLGDVEAWVPHQISLPLLREIHEGFETPTLRLVLNGDRYGNTGAASLYIALHEHRRGFGEGWVGLSALGGGMRWGAALWKGIG